MRHLWVKHICRLPIFVSPNTLLQCSGTRLQWGGFETGDDRFGLEHFPEMLNRFAIPLPESALIVLRGAFPERSETL